MSNIQTRGGNVCLYRRYALCIGRGVTANYISKPRTLLVGVPIAS